MNRPAPMPDPLAYGPIMTGPCRPVILGWRLDPATHIRVESVYIFDFRTVPGEGSPGRLESNVLVVYASARTGRLGIEFVDNFEVDLRPSLCHANQPETGPGQIPLVEGRESDGVGWGDRQIRERPRPKTGEGESQR